MKFRFNNRTIPFALLFTCFLSYGLLIPWLGFYWDDWPYTWFAQLLGPTGFTNVFAGDRPFLSLVYILSSQFISSNPVHWQIFGILCRWLAAMALWWALKSIWPANKRQCTWVAFLFAVFPGFGQQWISVIYSRAFLLMAAFFLSFGLMAKAIRNRGTMQIILLTLAALFCSAFALFSSEYFFGLELIRPFFIWYISSEEFKSTKKKISQTAKYWAPYLLLWGSFAIWRIFFFSSENYDIQATGSILNAPGEAIIQLIQVINETLFDSAISIWTQTLKVFTLPVNSMSTWLTILVVLVSLALMIFYFWNLHLTPEIEGNSTKNDHWGIQAAIAGLFGMVFSIIPFWAAGLPIKLIFPWDRFMLVIMVGASLFFVGMLEFFIKTEKRSTILLSLAIALAIGKHFESANTYRRDWNNQNTFFWQLAWRAPQIKPGSILLTHELPLQYYSDNSLTAPLNWIYDPDMKGEEMPYIMVYTKARLGNTLQDLSPDQAVNFDYRAFEFNGSTSDSIVFFYSSDNCLRILDDVYTPGSTFPNLPYQLTDAIPLSNLNLILDETDAAQSASPFFAKEPSHGWCYYFEKADLARQNADWKQITQIYQEVINAGLQPRHPSELLPFIEGLAMTGDIENAKELTQTMIAASDPQLLTPLCSTWNRISHQNINNVEIQESLQQILAGVECTFEENHE